MTEKVKKHLKIAFYIAIAIFGICTLISMPNSFKDYSSYTGLSVTLTLIVSVIYEKWVWRFNPFEKTPKLLNQYNGTIEYYKNGQIRNKTICVHVKQSLFNIEIQMATNEIESSTITSKVVKENGSHLLYYTYITNPKSKYSALNPIQYGTCRLIIDDIKKIEGVYWTSRKTKGDIYLKTETGAINEEGFQTHQA